MEGTITAAVGELFFLKTQEMVDNLLKIEYFHKKKITLNSLFMPKYICEILKHSIRYFLKKKLTKITFFSGGQTSCAP